MNKYIIGILTFAAGAAVGSVVTWQLLKNKYEQIAQEEIDSVKEVFSKRAEKEKEENEVEKNDVAETRPNLDKPDLSEYASILEENNYAEEPHMPEDVPYFIPVDDYGEFDDYETHLLTAYIDGTLLDDNDEIIDNPDDLVGEHTIFSAYQNKEEDTIYVRNDQKKCDYEILLIDEVYM